MAIRGYQIRHEHAIHFLTFTVVSWMDVFTRSVCRNVIIDSIRHCQDNRGLILNAWCLMTNHLHLVASARNNDLSAVVRDFKKFTSRMIINAIVENVAESRKGWMLPIFNKHGNVNSRNDQRQFWIQDNRPKECFSTAFTLQKINYIHDKPVAAGFVDRPEAYLYSSARDYFNAKNVGLLKVNLLLDNLTEQPR